ncbi:helix-turn-helix domain-containing protein [Amycolatopsis sp. DSM 110486]|uniref:helix-turn-helix domain-containing protein n=1 Tax=Amycolatopsis sp. DSM 110486 TaxID=2865832 RepID=UPI001C6995F7|nr:helix-turn-helix domain-containing protein [Amycolatopsis sp. DSM 110486]QYN19389.1 helix-turn-helix domain-containing protein [Amycolatopsis sp. DSM 110486]
MQAVLHPGLDHALEPGRVHRRLPREPGHRFLRQQRAALRRRPLAVAHSGCGRTTTPSTLARTAVRRRGRCHSSGTCSPPSSQLTTTISPVWSAAGLSVRGLRAAFHRADLPSPMKYLRELRVRRAHEELVAKSAEETTVTAVALRWGFSNAHRFAALHRELYGTSPGRALSGRDQAFARSPATSSSAAQQSSSVASKVEVALV